MHELTDLVRGVFNLTTATPLLITFQLPQWMVEPEGETGPPHNIVAKPDLEMVMSVHEWNTEPQLCVIFGAEDVAKYEFISRTPFKIGNRSFLGEGKTEEQHMSDINEMVGGQELLCSDQVLEEIFSEAELVSLYRFSFEIERARNRLDLKIGAANTTGDDVVPQQIQQNVREPRLSAQIGSLTTATELMPPLNYDVGSTSVQLTPVRRNEIRPDVPTGKVEEQTDLQD
ncbi:hypothetical protein Bca4012_043833 [Brassica carinata]|nr:PREDICTED: uncharacterized protein LOC106317387 [Brassica oleracea var. oleracea]XP_013669548.1 uncharacterized protein BNAC09G26040D [Brassica napus]KAG2276006.1 hypothetical protein Bca52824_058561 [Brassica carinata]VDD31090.1 unnamed protein product [Brassica oleracea]CAF1745401.1 unnamed protein product [Brassica napus]CDY40861.1 BnaC09g26040D [Brassica napus]